MKKPKATKASKPKPAVKPNLRAQIAAAEELLDKINQDLELRDRQGRLAGKLQYLVGEGIVVVNLDPEYTTSSFTIETLKKWVAQADKAKAKGYL